MSHKAPDPKSNRTWSRAADLAYARGCDTFNDCWAQCVEAARYQIVDGNLTDWDRQAIHDVNKVRYVTRETQ